MYKFNTNKYERLRCLLGPLLFQDSLSWA